MRKRAHSQWSELVEYIGKESTIMNFKVEASLSCQPHYLLQDESDRFIEKRIYEGIDNLSMLLSRMLIQDNMILNKEMGNIVVQIYIF
jgi:hypothetical protein